jgi:hypothetical protein
MNDLGPQVILRDDSFPFHWNGEGVLVTASQIHPSSATVSPNLLGNEIALTHLALSATGSAN